MTYTKYHENLINNHYKDKGKVTNAIQALFGPNLPKKDINTLTDLLLSTLGEMSLREKRKV
jgi:hypothetical protein